MITSVGLVLLWICTQQEEAFLDSILAHNLRCSLQQIHSRGLGLIAHSEETTPVLQLESP